MRRSSLRAGWVVACMACLAPASAVAQNPKAKPSAADSPPSPAKIADDRELRFLQGLRDLRYYDLAQDYAAELLARPTTSAELKAALAYETGRGLLDQATNTSDLEKRQVILEQARQQLDAFVKAHGSHALVPDALLQLARLHVERGHTAHMQGKDVKTEDSSGKPIPSAVRDRDAKLLSARASFAEARKAYNAAEIPLKAKYEGFARFYPEGDPRREARDRAHAALMDAQLQRAVVDYEEASTYPMGAAERTALLDHAIEQFSDLHKKYRTQLAGLHARMLQAKCLEEKGELGPAMGIYDELMQHTDPWLRALKRQVGHFRIIVIGRRKEHALAVDEADRWLKENKDHINTEEGLGVQLELAKNILAQLEQLSPADREQAIRTAVDRLTAVVRYFSPHKAEALELLQRYKPQAARQNSAIAAANFDEAMSKADAAIAAHDWNQAEAYLKQAIVQGKRTNEMDKVNRARYFLGYVYYASDRYYESAVVADHLAHRYPEGGLSARAAEIGLASLTQAYNTFTQVDRVSDITRMIELGRYIAETWPDSEQADNARLTLGEIALGRGEYPDAATWLESVGEGSPKRLDAQVKAGDAHWRNAQRLREEGKTSEADAEAKVALERVEKALQARDQAGIARTDPARIANVNALAEIHRSSGRAAEAIALLEPIAVALEGSNASADLVTLCAASLTVLLRSYLAAGQPEKAIGVMKLLETINPSKASLTRLYYELGQVLETELAALEKKNDPAAYKRTQQAYKQFLLSLASSEAGQSYESLQWAGESLLKLNMPAEAGGVLQRLLDTIGKDDAFIKSQGSEGRLLRTRLKLVAATRGQGNFDDARKSVQMIIDENPKMLEPLVEKGMVLESRALAENTKPRWQESHDFWKDLATRLQRSAQRRKESFDAWYHAAIALDGLGRKAEAVAMIKGIMTLTPSVGSPEMKAKYEDLLKRLGG